MNSTRRSTRRKRQGRPGRTKADQTASSARRVSGSQSGAITVEYALAMLIAAAILVGVEIGIFSPMTLEVFKNFMGFIAPPYP